MASETSTMREGWRASTDPGVYLFHVEGSSRLHEISVNRYRLSVDGGLDREQDRQAFTQSAAYWLDKEHGTPVGGSGEMHVISPTELSRSVTAKEYNVRPEKVGERTLCTDTHSDRAQIKGLVQSSLRRSIPDSRYTFQFLDKVIRRDIEFGGGEYDFGARRKHSLKVHITADGIVLLQVGVGYSLATLSPLNEMITTGEELPSWRVEHNSEVYSNSGTGWLRGWSELHYTDYSNSLGEVIAEYQKGVIDEDVRQELIEENPRLVKVDYGDFTGDQVPRALTLSPRTEQVEEQDWDFHDLFTTRRAMEPDERFDLVDDLVDDLGTLPGLDIEFESNPSNNAFNYVDMREGESRLAYGDGKHASKPSSGLKRHGVYRSPGKYRVGVLFPTNFKEIHQGLIDLIAKTLAQWNAPAGTSGYSYELGSLSEYSDVYQQLRDETDVVIAMVPDKGAADDFPGVEDPYDELKRTLMRQGIPSQMLQKSTAQDIIATSRKAASDQLVNVLSAVIAKAGGTPWQINEMPGETQAFMGLDVTRDQETGQHSGASASIVMRDGSTFAAESTTQQAGEKFVSDQVGEFVRDLVFDFADERDEPLDRLTILRDGKVHEDIEAIREGLSAVDAEIDIVGVRKRDQTRIAEFNGREFRIAQKGVGFVDSDRDQAIVHAFGKPEIDDDNHVGTPRTFRLIKDSGPTDIETLARQSFWLSEIHYGSPARSTRLPVPIKYADQAAKYVSDGYVDPGRVIRGPAYL
ncbi:Piwi domain-containing protein [Natronoarchaeum rubrum]|uniref:Piwi domain-containing protein n=1 Tax=Natronoarchaeum rubrum TaxID=755311 RepID=UPI0021134584|nr:Piwi domain-containing protein [Natronoarchaeum rubrum]